MADINGVRFTLRSIIELITINQLELIHIHQNILEEINIILSEIFILIFRRSYLNFFHSFLLEHHSSGVVAVFPSKESHCPRGTYISFSSRSSAPVLLPRPASDTFRRLGVSYWFYRATFTMQWSYSYMKTLTKLNIKIEK